MNAIYIIIVFLISAIMQLIFSFLNFFIFWIIVKIWEKERNVGEE